MAEPVSCACESCVECCTHTPGWFAPGEAEKAAALLGMTFEEFRKRLIKDYWVEGPSNVYLWRPRKLAGDHGRDVASSWPRSGRCVFLTADNRCEIHEAKPMECRTAFGCRSGKPGTISTGEREDVVELWRRAGNPLRAEAEASNV